jgi:chemotaxis protein MotA
MGVVHTMESLHLPPAELGVLIGHALVGTFLGILISYGFFAPLSTMMESKATEAGKPYHVIKAVLLASMNGYAPQTCIEFGRKVLFSTERPSFKEMEEDIKSRKGK